MIVRYTDLNGCFVSPWFPSSFSFYVRLFAITFSAAQGIYWLSIDSKEAWFHSIQIYSDANARSRYETKDTRWYPTIQSLFFIIDVYTIKGIQIPITMINHYFPHKTLDSKFAGRCCACLLSEHLILFRSASTKAVADIHHLNAISPSQAAIRQWWILVRTISSAWFEPDNLTFSIRY